MNKNQVSTKIILDKRRVRKSDGKYPLKLRIIHNRKSNELKLNFHFTEQEFNSVMDINSRSKNKKHREIINGIIKEVDKIIDNLPYYDIDNFKKQLFDNEKPISNIYDVFNMKSLEMEQEDRISSSNLYITVRNSLINFSNDKMLNFNKVDVNFLNKYVSWLKSKDVSYSTVNNYLRYIKAIFNYADAKNIYTKTKDTYPFGKYKIQVRASSHRNIALTKEEVEKFKKIETMPNSTKALAKDLWLFSMYNGGMNYIDIAHLTQDDIRNNVIVFSRKKTKNTSFITGKKTSIPLNNISLEIINRWKPNNRDLLFPILDKLEDLNDIKKMKGLMKSKIRTFNKYTKQVGKKLNIDFPLTSYVARHTFASLMQRKGKSLIEISEFTGHTDLKSLSHYLSGFDDKSKRDILSDVFDSIE